MNNSKLNFSLASHFHKRNTDPCEKYFHFRNSLQRKTVRIQLSVHYIIICISLLEKYETKTIYSRRNFVYNVSMNREIFDLDMPVNVIHSEDNISYLYIFHISVITSICI